jgi:hypothetical protein
MIDEDTLRSFAHFFSDERQLEKDYLVNLMLKAFSVNKISTETEFKGGTALYMFHGLDRFSEDLDFTYTGKDTGISGSIDSLLAPVLKDFELSYRVSKNKGNVLVKDSNGKILGTRTELFVEGPLFATTNVRHKIKFDVSFRGDAIMGPEPARITSKYADIGTILLPKMRIEEMLAEKFSSVAERTKARDLYDAYFMVKFKNTRYDQELVDEKMRRREEKFDINLLENRIKAFKESLWKEELSSLLKSLPKLGEVKRTLLGALG